MKHKDQLEAIEEKRKNGDLSESFFTKYEKCEDVPESQRTHRGKRRREEEEGRKRKRKGRGRHCAVERG